MGLIKDHLVKALRQAALFNPEIEVAPACILWPDRDRQWEASEYFGKILASISNAHYYFPDSFQKRGYFPFASEKNSFSMNMILVAASSV
jgi:hypothetical protein